MQGYWVVFYILWKIQGQEVVYGLLPLLYICLLSKEDTTLCI